MFLGDDVIMIFLLVTVAMFLAIYPLVSVLIEYAYFDQGDYNFLKVVTCGNVPLESSFQKVPRCVYTSTSLYEYRGCDSKAANPTHRRFTWGLRAVEVRKIVCPRT